MLFRIGGQALDTAKSIGPIAIRECCIHTQFRITKLNIVVKFGQVQRALETRTDVAMIHKVSPKVSPKQLQVQLEFLTTTLFTKDFTVILWSSQRSKTTGISTNLDAGAKSSQIHDRSSLEHVRVFNLLAAANVYQRPCGSIHDLRCQYRKSSDRMQSYLIRRLTGRLHSR